MCLVQYIYFFGRVDWITLTQKVDNDDVDHGLVNNDPMPHERHTHGKNCKGVLSNGL